MKFLNFRPWVKELANSVCRFGFLVKNSICSQLDMSRIQKFDPKIRNFRDSCTEKCHFLSYVSTVGKNTKIKNIGIWGNTVFFTDFLFLLVFPTQSSFLIRPSVLYTVFLRPSRTVHCIILSQSNCTLYFLSQ